MKDLLNAFMLWCNYIPLSSYYKKMAEVDVLKKQILDLEQKIREGNEVRQKGIFEMITGGNQHQLVVFYEDVQFKIIGCMHCNKHLVQCHAKHEFTEDMVEHFKTIPGIDQSCLNGKYTVEFLKGVHFEWNDLLKKLIPAIKYFTRTENKTNEKV